MTGQVAFGGLTFTGQATAFAASTTPTKLTFAGASELPTTRNRYGDPAVKADIANNRVIVNAPGIYRCMLEVSGVAASALQSTIQFRKGTVAAGKQAKMTWGTTPNTQTIDTLIEVTAADIPSSGGVATFPDPDATPGAGKPAGGFAGAGAAPQTGVALQVYLTGDGSVNLTLSDGSWIVERIG